MWFFVNFYGEKVSTSYGVENRLMKYKQVFGYHFVFASDQFHVLFFAEYAYTIQ